MKREKITKQIISQTGIVPQIGMFGLDHLETAKIMRRLLKPYGLRLKVKTWREDDQSWVWIEPKPVLATSVPDETVESALVKLRERWAGRRIEIDPPFEGDKWWVRIGRKDQAGYSLAEALALALKEGE